MSEPIEFKTFPCEVRAGTGDEWPGSFEGLAAAFHNIDAVGDIVAPGAFAADLSQFLAEGFIGGCNHDWDQPIGRPLAVEERPEGLYLRGSISDTAHGRDVRTLMRDGVVRRLSIGFRTLEREWLETEDDVAAWWEEAGYQPGPEDRARSARGARLLTRVCLVEVSPVALPANRRAVVTAVKDLWSEETPSPHQASAGRLRAAFEALRARRLGVKW